MVRVKKYTLYANTDGTKQCAFFDTPLGCRSGEQCKFLHEKQTSVKNDIKYDVPQKKSVPIFENEPKAKRRTIEQREEEETETKISIAKEHKIKKPKLEPEFFLNEIEQKTTTKPNQNKKTVEREDETKNTATKLNGSIKIITKIEKNDVKSLGKKDNQVLQKKDNKVPDKKDKKVLQKNDVKPPGKKDNKVPEKKDNKVSDKKDNKVLEKKDNKVPEKKDNKVPEKKDNKVPEKKDTKKQHAYQKVIASKDKLLEQQKEFLKQRQLLQEQLKKLQGDGKRTRSSSTDSDSS